MPIYDYKCGACGSVFTKSLGISNREQPKEEACPNCSVVGEISQVILGAPSIGDAVRLGVTRPDGGMKEVIQKIHERTPGSRLNDNSQLTRV